jgi:hypothetical protein
LQGIFLSLLKKTVKAQGLIVAKNFRGSNGLDSGYDEKIIAVDIVWEGDEKDKSKPIALGSPTFADLGIQEFKPIALLMNLKNTNCIATSDYTCSFITIDLIASKNSLLNENMKAFIAKNGALYLSQASARTDEYPDLISFKGYLEFENQNISWRFTEHTWISTSYYTVMNKFGSPEKSMAYNYPSIATKEMYLRFMPDKEGPAMNKLLVTNLGNLQKTEFYYQKKNRALIGVLLNKDLPSEKLTIEQEKRNHYFIFARIFSSSIKGVFCGLSDYGLITVEYKDPDSILKLFFKSRAKNQTFKMERDSQLESIKTPYLDWHISPFEYTMDDTRFDQKFCLTDPSQVNNCIFKLKNLRTTYLHSESPHGIYYGCLYRLRGSRRQKSTQMEEVRTQKKYSRNRRK